MKGYCDCSVAERLVGQAEWKLTRGGGGGGGDIVRRVRGGGIGKWLDLGIC